MRIQNLLPFGAIIASTALFACGSNTGSSGPGGAGGANVGGSSSTGTTAPGTGGSSSAGGAAQTGGANTNAGGNVATGGANTAQGGANTGGSGTKATGGTGSGTGGKTGVGGTSSATGGKSGTTTGTGGKTGVGGTSSATGGKSGTTTGTGGKSGVGGTSSGDTGVGGTSTDGGTSATGGTSSSGSRPKGYWYLTDWNVSTPDWHGCAWTGIDTVSGTTTTISTPSSKDFMTTADGGPYRIAGTVHNAYESVALLGFNVNEAISGDANQCKYDPATATADGPPTVTPTNKGLAINWSATTLPTVFRVQIQGVDGASNGNHRWCAQINDTTGPSFVAWTDFYTNCWNVGVASPPSDAVPVKYNNEPFDAVVFLVPGTTAKKEAFDITVVGFAPGASSADAPGPSTCATAKGTLGSTTASEDASMQRKRVTDCATKKDYIVFNNNWGTPSGSTQLIDYSGNSFTVKQGSTGTGSGAPASFPCIYVGANGDLGGGSFNTWSNTGLPKQISAMQSAQTTFTWTGNGGDYNAAYDVWFAKSSPTAGGYNDAISGFLMVWLYKPGNRQPIGQSGNTRTATIAGKSWTVWRGPRGNTSTGTDDANRPVISYVATSQLNTLTFNLKDFIDDAVKNGDADKSAGGTSQAFSNSWYLTDVFAGFEAWTGSSITNNTATMSIDVK